MAERRKLDNGDTEELLDSTDPNISFTERLRRRRLETKAGISRPSRFQAFLRVFVIVFQIPTEIYVYHNHIIPYYLDGYSPMTIYYAKVISFFIGLMLVVNWTCVRLFDPALKKTKDKPLLPVTNGKGEGNEYFVARIQESTSNGVGNHSVYNIQSETSTSGLPWDYCEKCQMHIPYRTRHCSVCKKCILKKDHHCYITGCCVGFRNQRYFVVLTFYVILAGIFGGIITCKYVSDVVWVDLNSCLDLVFPVPIFRWIFGSLQGLHCLIIIQIYIEFVFGLVSFGFFSLQVLIISKGITFSEDRNMVRIKNTNPLSEKLRSVFGDFWLLNFIFPMTLIFKQKDDGMTWEGVILDSRPIQSFSKQQ